MEGAGAYVEGPGESDLRREGVRIEGLLDDLQALAAGPVWQRVEELVQRLVRLYGVGLGRLIDCVANGGTLDEAVAARVAQDELLASLLLLHGLHPWPTEVRVRRALETLRSELGPEVGVGQGALDQAFER